MMLCLPLSAVAQGTEILLDPTPVEVGSGDPFTVTLKINNIPGPGSLAAYDFRITFTPGVIQFGENEGDHDWTAPEFGEPFAFNVDNAAGSISFNDILTASPYPSGDITLAVLHGTATAALSTSTPPHFDKAEILDPFGDPISATVTDGDVRVTVTTPPTGIPTLSQWGMIGMAVLFGAVLIWFVRRRWVVNASNS